VYRGFFIDDPPVVQRTAGDVRPQVGNGPVFWGRSVELDTEERRDVSSCTGFAVRAGAGRGPERERFEVRKDVNMSGVGPRVSIGMPVYNSERFIREALDSIVHQTFRDWELTIWDTASRRWNSRDLPRIYEAG
jgi:hypothetical protein